VFRTDSATLNDKNDSPTEGYKHVATDRIALRDRAMRKSLNAAVSNKA
jgi:hypothetical protein